MRIEILTLPYPVFRPASRPAAGPGYSTRSSIHRSRDIEKVLSADDMQGRRPFTPGIEKAADFIEAQFRAAGLQSWNNSGSYRTAFLHDPREEIVPNR